MAKKVLFINTEITPYVPETPLSLLGKSVPQAIQEKGFRVPEDVSIIGMDDTDICLACNPQLTTFHVHRREIGRIAVRQLLTPPAAEKGVYVKTEVSVSLVRRGSVRKIDGMIL